MTWADDVTLTVEVGFGSGPLAATPTWTDITDDVRAVITDRGRRAVHETFDAGDVTIVVDNRAATYDPNNSASAHAGNLKIGTPIRIQATHALTTYPVFYGQITEWPLRYEMPAEATVELAGVESVGVIRTALVEASYSKESTDTRIAGILDDIGWPAGARSLDAGSADVAAITFNGKAGDLIDEVVEAEQGLFFIARDGDATFLNRIAFSTSSSEATFGPGAGEVGFVDFVPGYDKDSLINEAHITAADGGTGSASDAASKTDHGAQAYTTESIAVFAAPEALNVAEWIVGKRKDVLVRIRSVVVWPQNDPTVAWPAILGLELGDLVTVKFSPPGTGDDLNQVASVEGIRHEIAGGAWVTTLSLYPLSAFETQDYWILGTSDDLGTDTILA